MNVNDSYSVTHRRVAKIYSELVALRLLYTMTPTTNCSKKVESGLFSHRGSHILVLNSAPIAGSSCPILAHFSTALKYVSSSQSLDHLERLEHQGGQLAGGGN